MLVLYYVYNTKIFNLLYSYSLRSIRLKAIFFLSRKNCAEVLMANLLILLVR